MIPCPCKQPFPRNFCLVQWVGYREIFISACFALGGIRIWLGAIAGGCSSVHLIGSIVGPLFVIPSSATWWILSVASASFSGVCASLSVIRRCPILMGNYNRWITPLFLWDSWFSLIDIHSAAISRIINHHDSYFDKRSPPVREEDEDLAGDDDLELEDKVGTRRVRPYRRTGDASPHPPFRSQSLSAVIRAEIRNVFPQ